jgi:hypothetical protein
MRTIEMTITITDERKITIALPPDVAPGDHHAVLVLEEIRTTSPPARTSKPPLKLAAWKWEAWPEECTFRREDIYGDDGR